MGVSKFLRVARGLQWLAGMTKQRYTMTFAGSVYQLGQLDAEQMATIQALIQYATFQPAGTPITEDNRWIRIDGTAGPVLQLDRRITTAKG